MVATIAVGALTGLLACGAALADDAQLATAFRLTTPIKVDGDLGDWPKAAMPILIDKQSQLTPGADSTDNWSGPSDLSGKIYVAYDDQYLYLAADVTDDVVIQEFEGIYLYQGDSVELYLDTDLSDAGSGTYSEDDWQLAFTPGTQAAKPDRVLFQQVSGREVNGVVVAAKKTAKGYMLEVAIPLSELKLTPKAGLEIGFDTAINDVDTAGVSTTENQIILGGSADGWQNPDEFARLRFQ